MAASRSSVAGQSEAGQQHGGLDCRHHPPDLHGRQWLVPIFLRAPLAIDPDYPGLHAGGPPFNTAERGFNICGQATGLFSVSPQVSSLRPWMMAVRACMAALPTELLELLRCLRLALVGRRLAVRVKKRLATRLLTPPRLALVAFPVVALRTGSLQRQLLPELARPHLTSWPLGRYCREVRNSLERRPDGALQGGCPYAEGGDSALDLALRPGGALPQYPRCGGAERAQPAATSSGSCGTSGTPASSLPMACAVR